MCRFQMNEEIGGRVQGLRGSPPSKQSRLRDRGPVPAYILFLLSTKMLLTRRAVAQWDWFLYGTSMPLLSSP